MKLIPGMISNFLDSAAFFRVGDEDLGDEVLRLGGQVLRHRVLSTHYLLV